MPNTLELQPKIKEDDYAYFLKKAKENKLPFEYTKVFFRSLNILIAYYKKLIDEIIDCNGGVVKMPMQESYIENYCSGFSFEYIPIGELEGLEGLWEREEGSNLVKIYYRNNCSSNRQRFTKIHELFHFLQSIDPRILDFFDRMLEKNIPEDIVMKLVEKSVDKATAIYLMPNEYFIKKYKEMEKVSELSEFFEVSEQAVTYRLKECGIII